MSTSRILRDRQAETVAARDRSNALDEPGGISILVQTKIAAEYPTSPASYFACEPLYVDGSEREGEAASFTPDPARTFFAYNIGSRTPPVGTKLLAACCGGRWIFSYDG